MVGNVMVSKEQHVDWLALCTGHLAQHDLEYVEPTLEAENDWVDQVNETAAETLFPEANS